MKPLFKEIRNCRLIRPGSIGASISASRRFRIIHAVAGAAIVRVVRLTGFFALLLQTRTAFFGRTVSESVIALQGGFVALFIQSQTASLILGVTLIGIAVAIERAIERSSDPVRRDDFPQDSPDQSKTNL